MMLLPRESMSIWRWVCRGGLVTLCLGYDRFRSQSHGSHESVPWSGPPVTKLSPSEKTKKSISCRLSPYSVVAVIIVMLIAIAPLPIAQSIWNRQLVQPETSAGATACHRNDTKFPEIGSPLSSVPIRNFTPVFRCSDL